MTDDAVGTVAAALAEAHRTAVPVDRESLPSVATVADGYRAQERLVELLREDRGEPVGYKVGFTNERVRADLGVDEPSYGRVLADTVRPSPATVDAADFVGVRVEPEIAFRLDDDLSPGAGREEARDALAAVVPAVELVDSRTGWAFDATLAVADNSLDAGLVVGDDADPGALNTGEEEVTLRVDGEAVDSGTGADVLGDPLAALRWLTGAVDGLPAGTVVSTGSLTKPRPVASGDRVTAAFSSLDDVELRLR